MSAAKEPAGHARQSHLTKRTLSDITNAKSTLVCMTQESDPSRVPPSDVPPANTPDKRLPDITLATPGTYSDSPPIHAPLIYVMGVSGCGKSTVARQLAERLSMAFCEADELHPESNIRKMSEGVPLTDEDRLPWLGEVKTHAMVLAVSDENNRGCVIACSALKKIYRDILGSGDRNTWFVYLKGDYDTIAQRMAARTGHFMPDKLLQSQFDALEAPDDERNVVVISVINTAEQIADLAADQLIPRLLS